MSSSTGGIIHTYQKYDPVNFPSPTAPPPDLVSPAFEHLLQLRRHCAEFTEEELAKAVRTRPQPDRRARAEPRRLRQMLLETGSGRSSRPTRPKRVQKDGRRRIHDAGDAGRRRRRSCAGLPRRRCARSSSTTSRTLWYRGRRRPRTFARDLRAARRAARREVPGRRAGREVRVHRPHADDRAARRSRSRKSWRRSTSCSSSSKRRRRPPRSASSTWRSCPSSPSRATSSSCSSLQQQIEDYLREHGRAAGARAGRAQAASR